MRFLLKTIFWALALVFSYLTLHFWLGSNTAAAICFCVLAVISFICIYGVKHSCPKCHTWFTFSESDRTLESREPYKVAKDRHLLFRSTYNVKYTCLHCGYSENRLVHVKEEEES